MKFDPAVYPECSSREGIEKVHCLISEIQRDKIPRELKRRRINYLIALNARAKWGPQQRVKALVRHALARLEGRVRRLDPWEDDRFTMRFDARVEVLYMRREDIDREWKAGHISKEDYERYWRKVKARHLEEFAIRVSGRDAEKLKAWIKTWGHKGGSWYMKNGYALRCGGANQCHDPLNVFILFE